MSRRSSRICLYVTFLLLPAVSLPAQISAGSPGQTILKTTSRAVVVDVVVDTAKGEPVPALRQQEFQVLEDGKPQAINFFEEHKAKTLPPGALQPLPPMPPNVYTNVPPAPLSDAVNVLMFDTLNTPVQDFAYARNEAIQFLHNVTPGTRLSIVTLSDKLTFVTGFTTDASTLLAAIEDKKTGVMPETGSAQNFRGEEASSNAMIAMLSEGPAGRGGAALANAFVEEQAYDARMRTLMTMEALQDLSKHLAAVPGRKNLLWFSSDFPVRIFPNPGEQDYGNLTTLIPESLLRKTAGALTAARIAVYPINAKGVMNDEVLNADSRGLENTSNPAHLGSNDPTYDPAHPMNAYHNEAQARAAEIEGMNQLAAETGGKAIYNTNDLNTAAQRAISDGAHYYTLSYSPTNKKMDGNYRSIEVKVAGGKYKLSYRYGYNADDESKTPAPADPDPLRPMLRYGLPNATQILYGVRVVPVAPQPAPNATRAGKNPQLTGPVTRYSVDFMIRWTDVKLNAEQDGTHSGKVQVGLLAYDSDGNAVNWEGGTQMVRLHPDIFAAIQKSGIPAHMEIDLPAGKDIYLETGVYDWNTSKVGTLEIPLHSDPAAAAAIRPTDRKTN